MNSSAINANSFNVISYTEPKKAVDKKSVQSFSSQVEPPEDKFQKKPSNYKQNLENAKKENRLTYKESETFFFGLYTRDAEYTYKAKKGETIADIREKFNLKDGALSDCNRWIVDAQAPLPEGKEIFFMEKDIKKQ